MGLITGAIDIVVVSAGCAAVRRFTGLNIASKVQARIKNPTFKAASIAYFGLGETIVNQTINLTQKWEVDWKESQLKMKEMELLARRLREEREKEKKENEDKDKKDQ